MPQFWKVMNIPFWEGRISELRSTEADHMSSWADLVLPLATRCLYYGGVYLSSGQLHLHLIGSQPASQLASCNWPANQPCDKISTCQTSGWSDMWWQGASGWHFVWYAVSQPVSLPAAIGQPTSHVTRYQPVRLWVGQIFGGRMTGSPTTMGPSPGYQHSHWFPFGSDLPDWGHAKWHTWALQPVIYLWHYI